MVFQDVPLSGEAIRILCQLPGIEGTENVFNITSGNLDALFQKAKKRAMTNNLHFHDTRHEAITGWLKNLIFLILPE